MFRRRGENEARTNRGGRAAGAGGTGAGGRPDAHVPRGGAQDAARSQTAETEPFTYIQRGTTIVGKLEASGRVRVHGVVRGDVRVDGALEVAEAGLVQGTSIEADEVKIIGRVVVDKLVARGKVEIWDGGELIGDVQAASLDIEEGARFTGRSDMTGGASQDLDSAADTLLDPAEVGRAEVEEPVGTSAEKVPDPL